MNRWMLTGLEGYDKERNIIKSLVNSGEIDVPASKDGRYTNVASINVKGQLFASKAELKVYLTQLEKELKVATTNAEKIAIQRNMVIAKALN